MSSQALMLLACYLSLSSGEFISTSSYICGSWYLHIFLLRDGSFTLMSMACWMDLAKLWSSLPTVLKLLIDILWPVVLWWSWMGDGAFMCSLYLSANVLPGSPLYSSLQSTLLHLHLYITPLLCQLVSLSLGLTRRSLMVLPSLKCICMPCLLQMFLQLSLKPLMYGTTMWGLWVLLVVLFLVLLELLLYLLDLILALFKGQPWYLHLLNACMRWFSFPLSSWELEQKFLAVCVKVLMTLYLAARLWWWSHCQYNFVCVGFLYTVVMRYDQCVQQRNWPIFSWCFWGELDVWVQAVKMF